MLPPTSKQRAVERFVIAYMASNDGVAPSIREIAVGLNKAPSSVCSLLARMEARGRIHRRRGQPRSVQVLA
ncbi:LexA family protein [Rhodomicrobium sp.]|uniref:LexA family protein n=1 Tax=Rhodomicrobium sp. TaxID=2720632 RepID=UPI0039E53DD0